MPDPSPVGAVGSGCATAPLDAKPQAWRDGACWFPRTNAPVIDLWRLRRHELGVSLDAAASWLQPDELRRAGRYRRRCGRERFVVGRAGLRAVLSRYALVEPPRVRLQQSCLVCGSAMHGAVRVRGPGLLVGLHVSVSHTRGHSFYVVARSPVGIDVEDLTHDLHASARAVADLALTPGERRRIAGMARADRDAAVLGVWTRKEALLKGLGAGLELAPDEVEVGALVERSDGAATPRWHLHTFDPGDGMVGSVAVAMSRCVVRSWDLALRVLHHGDGWVFDGRADLAVPGGPGPR